MRALVARLGALLVVATASCAGAPDPGNLVIRCPDSSGAIAVTDGQVTVSAVPMRVVAELSGPATPDEGMAFAIEVRLPDSPRAASPSIQCVRIRLLDENAQWDAVPRRIDEFRDGSNARVRATGRDGPHWRSDKPVDVTVWLKTASGRHVLALGRQPIHTAP
jgi:hypothetical protein